MSQLIEQVYASRSAFEVNQSSGGVAPEVARILAQSRRNNQKLEIGGLLYYGDGCFFQCLEGEEEKVEALFRRIRRDPRHRDIQVLSRRKIDQRRFGDWFMKYVPAEAGVRQFLADRGMRSFDPYAFDHKSIAEMLGVLDEAEDLPTQALDAEEVRSPRLSDRQLAIGALVLAALAVILSSMALVAVV